MKNLTLKNHNIYIATFLLSLFLASNMGFVALAAVPAPPPPGPSGTGPTPGAGTGSSVSSIVCDPSKFSLEKLMSSFPINIISTYLLSANGAGQMILPLWLAMGVSPAEMQGCLGYIGDIARTLPLGQAAMAQNCPTTAVPVCASLLNQYAVGGAPLGAAGDSTATFASNGFTPSAFANSKVSGSLLGYAYLVSNTIQYEPVPVNTAYFFNSYLAKIPVVGDKAYAATQGAYGQTLINASLGIWEIFRNIAYGLMALVMLWVGFAIITRRRISAQTVVSVQYALPKIVIALILIAFSYPIGATITSISWALWNSAPKIIQSLSGATTFADLYAIYLKLGIGGQMILLFSMLAATSGGGALLLISILILIVCIVFFLWAYLKSLWLYIKMVINTATSPLQIAMFALPGQDDKLEKWFMQMLAMGMGLFGMRMVMDLTGVFALELIGNAFTADTSTGAFSVAQAIVSGQLFNFYIAPMLIVFGYATAIKVPDMLDEMLVNPKGKKR